MLGLVLLCYKNRHISESLWNIFLLFALTWVAMSASPSPGAQQQRFAAYLDRLAQAAEHLDRIAPLKSYCTGLLLPGERKSVEADGGAISSGQRTAHASISSSRGGACPVERRSAIGTSTRGSIAGHDGKGTVSGLDRRRYWFRKKGPTLGGSDTPVLRTGGQARKLSR